MNKIYRIIGMFDTATPFYYSGNSVKTLNFGVILDASALWSTLFPLDFLPPQPVQGLQFIGNLSAKCERFHWDKSCPELTKDS